MAANLLETRVRFQDEIAVIQLKGEIDALSEEPLNTAFKKVEGWKPAAVLLDMSAVEYINSTGIALIIGLLGRSRKGGIKLIICGLSDHYQEIFRITRLADFIDIYPDESEALAHAVAGT